MDSVYVLITSEVGRDDSIIALLKNIENVKEAHGTFGSYDIITKLEANNEDELQNTISKHIRKIQLIRSTLTLSVQKNAFRKTNDDENEVLAKHMAHAYILINCTKLDLERIVKDLQKIPEVIECNSLFGSFELICKVVAPSYNDISEIVSKKIRKIPGIKSTVTLNVIENQGFNK